MSGEFLRISSLIFLDLISSFLSLNFVSAIELKGSITISGSLSYTQQEQELYSQNNDDFNLNIELLSLNFKRFYNHLVALSEADQKNLFKTNV